LAALANGVSAHAMDYDLTYCAGQAISGLIPAILPVAETTNASPSEALSAFIIGAEVCGRMYRAAPTMFRLANWHSTGTIGTMAVAAACARLLKAPAATIPNIVGVTASLAGGVTANFGTMTKPLHAGHAARNGILAVQLGMKGFTSSATAIEGPSGFLDNFARGLNQSLEPFRDLGNNWDLEQYGYKLKPYPSGGLGHTAIDAALELRGTVPLSDVASVEVAITKYAARRISALYPETVEAAKFSGPYLAAHTLVRGAPMLAAFTEEALHDAVVQAFARKVSLATYAEYADLLDESPAKVTITLTDGRKIERAKYYPTGSVQVPMTKGRIEEKFTTCATTAIEPDGAKKVLATLSTLGEQPSFDDFWRLLSKG
jgi:2-methylcitrate dehydratase PrpD